MLSARTNTRTQQPLSFVTIKQQLQLFAQFSGCLVADICTF